METTTKPNETENKVSRIVMTVGLVRALTMLTDKERGILGGLYFESIGSRLTVVATNGWMMAVLDVSDYRNTLPAEGVKMVIPVPRIPSEDAAESEMWLTVVESRVVWEDAQGFETTVSVIDAPFVNWREAMKPTRDCEAAPVVPLDLNPKLCAQALAVLQFWIEERSCEGGSGVSILPAKGIIGFNGCAHVFRPWSADLRDRAVVLLMPVRSKDEARTALADVVPPWMFLEGWRDIKTAPKNSRLFRAVMMNGDIYENVHWASDLSGEEQPAFQGYYIPDSTGKGFSAIEEPFGWMPLPTAK